MRRDMYKLKKTQQHNRYNALALCGEICLGKRIKGLILSHYLISPLLPLLELFLNFGLCYFLYFYTFITKKALPHTKNTLSHIKITHYPQKTSTYPHANFVDFSLK